MFGPPGHAYVYFTYGMWLSLNLVCGPEGTASGVLLRAGEILVRRRARPQTSTLGPQRPRNWPKGPARLATALDVDRSLDGTDVCAGGTAPRCRPHRHPPAPDQVRNGPRTGVGGDGAAHPWRFWIADDPTVSPYRAHVADAAART